MAGTFPGFPSDAFRDGIRFAMDMGAAPESPDRATFFFPSELVYMGDGGLDADGVPFDPNETVQRVEPPSKQVPCAMEYYDELGRELGALGVGSASRVHVLLLDEEYQQVKDANRVVIAGDTYWYRRLLPPSGLFDVGVYTLVFSVEQET